MTANRSRALLPNIIPLLLVIGCQAPAPHTGSATPATTAPHSTPSQRIRVGAWNIEWLGDPQRRSGPARGHLQTAEDLADYIVASRAAIIGLEEVARSDQTGPWTNERLDAALKLVSQRTGGRWEHRLFPAHSGRNQLCGIAWDADQVSPVGEPRPIVLTDRQSSLGKPLWYRPPHGQLFSTGPGRTDFVVVVIHMKSNYGGDFLQHRAEEAQALATALPGARTLFADDDVMIVGDSNCGSHTEPGVQALVAAGYLDLNRSDEATHWKYGALDRIFIPADQPEFSSAHFDVVRDGFLETWRLSLQDFKIRYSDHFMVVTEVHVMADDD